MVRGASGDEWGELIGGKGTIGLQAAVPKKAPLATFKKKVVKEIVRLLYGDGLAYSVYCLGCGINGQVLLVRYGAGTKDFYLQIIQTAS